MHKMLGVAVLTGAAFGAPALAQEMGQGEARITTESNVEMRVDSAPGTGGARLAALGRAVGTQLGAIRACYADVIKERPTVEGKLSLDVSLPPRGKLRVGVGNESLSDRGLVRCVTKAVKKAQCTDVKRPATAVIRLQFRNTAAAGAATTAERRAEEADVDVRKNGEGMPEASGGTPDRKVRFTVTGKAASQRETVAAVYRALRSAVPHLLDCRRRASSRGRSPEGEIDVALRISRAGSGKARITRNTMEADEKAGRCITRALGRTHFSREAAGATMLELRFAGRESETAETRATRGR